MGSRTVPLAKLLLARSIHRIAVRHGEDLVPWLRDLDGFEGTQVFVPNLALGTVHLHDELTAASFGVGGARVFGHSFRVAPHSAEPASDACDDELMGLLFRGYRRERRCACSSGDS